MVSPQRIFDDNESVWLLGKLPYEPRPPLTRDLELDVAIVGGGFTGVSTAYHLSERLPELGIAILEARALGNGASGRNGGQMLNGVHGVDDPSEEKAMARRLYDTTNAAIDDIIALIQRHGLDVPHRRDGHLDVLTSAEAAGDAEWEVEALNGAGIPVAFLDATEAGERIALEGIYGAVLDPGSGQLDGLAFVRGLRPVLEARGVRVFESTPVVRIHEGKTVELETPKARVRAKAMVLATNAYTPHLGYFRRSLLPLQSHVIAVGDGHERWHEHGWKSVSSFTDDRDRLSYATLTAGGRLLFGGGSNAAYDYCYGNRTGVGSPPPRGVRACHERLLAYLPGVEGLPIVSRWSGPVALTLSRIPSMGVRGIHRNVYFAFGFSGHGVTLANLAGRVLTDLYSGDSERWRGLPFFEPPRYIPPEPFRFAGYHLVTRLTGRSPRVRSRRLY